MGTSSSPNIRILLSLVGQCLLRGGFLSWDSQVTENTHERAFLHQRSETNPGHTLSGEEMHNRSLLPWEMRLRWTKDTEKNHHQLSVPLLMQRYIWWDILSVKTRRENNPTKQHIQNNQEIPQYLKIGGSVLVERSSRTCPPSPGQRL